LILFLALSFAFFTSASLVNGCGISTSSNPFLNANAIATPLLKNVFV